MQLPKFLNDIMTGKDNQTVAISKVLSLAFSFVTMGMVIIVTTFMLFQHPPPDLASWGMFFMQVGTLYATVMSSVLVFIKFLSSQEPGHKVEPTEDAEPP